MRRNAKFTFTVKENRPPLSASEMRYWKDILSKICKIGFEHEYNLKENKGSCTGDTLICPCVNSKRETTKCHEKCVKFNTCRLKNKYDCPGIYCIDFQSPCPTCKDMVKDCSKCPFYNDPKKNPSNVRKYIRTKLKPTGDLSSTGTSGALQVTTDGSLAGDAGIEITTVGRRVSYEAFKTQADKIVKECIERGAYVDERTSMHMHLVGGYYNFQVSTTGIKAVYNKGSNNSSRRVGELEKDMPDIILANFHQLIRRYHNALTWITSSGNDPNSLTRWVKFRKPILKYSAVRRSMASIKNQLSEYVESSGKYGFVNYYNTIFDSVNGSIRVLHLEGRFSDGMMSASAIAAFGVLLYCLLMKAVSLSQYGIVHSGTPGYMDEAYIIQNVLLNNNGSYSGPRKSDTSRFQPYIETVRRQAEEMISLLHYELRQHGEALKVLRSLADMPCSMRRIRGDSWEKIEKDLSGGKTKDKLIKIVMEAIDTFYIDDCESPSEWATALSEDVNKDIKQITSITDKLEQEHFITWDGIAGTYVRC